MIMRGKPSEYWISICSFRPKADSWGQQGASSVESDNSTANSGSANGALPIAVDINLGFRDIFLVVNL
jgi:hypothetical protein